MRRIVLIILFIFSSFAGYAQYGPVYGQYLHNPYLYNPGFAGVDNYSVLFLTHRRQLMGVEDAPVASTLVFHTPIMRNVALGTKISTESQGLLKNSSGMLSLVYVLPFGEYTNIRFGLSGGLTRNLIDLSSATESQMAYLAGISQTSNQVDVQFGLVFKHKDIKFGVSMPNMTRRDLISYSSMNPVEIDPFSHVVATGSFKMELVPDKIQLEPCAIYERFNSTGEQRIEGGALFYYNDLLWVGGNYRLNAGMSTLIGIKLKEAVSFGYSFEMTNNVTNSVYKNTSHEVQIRIRLGKERTFEKAPKTHKPRFQQSNS